MTESIRNAAVGDMIEGSTLAIYSGAPHGAIDAHKPSGAPRPAAWSVAAAGSVTRTIRLVAMATLLATPAAFAADATKGKAAFDAKCGACHSATAAVGGAVAGPSLFGVMGRKAATVESFRFYTPALKNFGITWNEKIMEEFLANPMGKAPGTTMVIALPDPKERSDVIAYLKTLKK